MLNRGNSLALSFLARWNFSVDFILGTAFFRHVNQNSFVVSFSRSAFSEPVQDNAFAGKSDESLMKIADKAVKETRTAKRSKK